MIVKVCGTTERGVAGFPTDGSVDWLGVIFVEDSPRFAGRQPFARPDVTTVAVFRDATTELILDYRSRWRFAGVQLHGAESAKQARALRRAGLFVVKALHVTGPEVLAKAELDYPPDSVDYFLFDTPGGGTGRTFDWTWLSAYAGETPFLLAGGIGPGDGDRLLAIDHARLAGIDLNSRFELAPGVKDYDALQTFLRDELRR